MQISCIFISQCCKDHKQKRDSTAAPPTEGYLNCQQAALPPGPFINQHTYT